MLFHLESLEKKQIVNMRELKLDHRNYHDFDKWVSTWESPSRGFRPCKTQTNLLSYRDKLEYWNFACNKFINYTFQRLNNKVTDQFARLRRLVCAFVVEMQLP